MAEQITEITRRDLREALANVAWWGRLDEITFLKRLYQLDWLASEDERYGTAEDDITQHRVANNDWADDWVFGDDRFNLAKGDDESLLRFLCEMLHPVVRKEDESERLVSVMNGLLRADGYQIIQDGAISGRPVYGWERIDPVTLAVDAHFTKDVRPLIATVSELAEHDGSDMEQEVLRSARPRLEDPEHDNWDGGSNYYTLTLVVPVPVFARLGNEVSVIEQQIAKRIEAIQRTPDRHRITAVVIQPGQVKATGSQELSKVIADRSNGPAPQFWTVGQFRLFLSHESGFKQRTAALRQRLSRYYISAFVAHDDIDAGKLWQREIEAALRSMDGMVAILTPGFRQSKWTDQEVGWALGRGIYVLPVRKGLDPYGFIGEVQGIQGESKTISMVADEIFRALVDHGATRERMQEALVAGFESSASAADAVANAALLERAGKFSSTLVRRIETAVSKNTELSSAEGMAESVRRISAARALSR